MQYLQVTLSNNQDQPQGDVWIYTNWKLPDSKQDCQAKKYKKLSKDKESGKAN